MSPKSKLTKQNSSLSLQKCELCSQTHPRCLSIIVASQPIPNLLQAPRTRRKACGTHRDGKTASQAKQTTYCKQCWHTVTNGRKQSNPRGSSSLFWPVPFRWMMPREYTGVAFFLFPKPKWRLEGYKVWIRTCSRPHDQILDQQTWSTLGRLEGRAWMCLLESLRGHMVRCPL